MEKIIRQRASNVTVLFRLQHSLRTSRLAENSDLLTAEQQERAGCPHDRSSCGAPSHADVLCLQAYMTTSGNDSNGTKKRPLVAQ